MNNLYTTAFYTTSGIRIIDQEVRIGYGKSYFNMTESEKQTVQNNF